MPSSYRHFSELPGDAPHRALLEHGDASILLLDRSGRVTYATPGVARWLGGPKSVSLGQIAFEHLHPDDRDAVINGFSGLTSTPGASQTWLARVRSPNGEWRRISIIATNALDDEQVRGVMVYLRDVTDTLQLREQIRQAQRVEIVARLARDLAHDINNALTVILSYADLLTATAHGKERLGLEEIHLAARGATTLTRQLGQLARRSSSGAEYVDAHTAIERAHAVTQRALPPTVRCRLDVPRDLPLIWIDPLHFDQLLVNLFLHTGDALASGGLFELGAAVNAPTGATGTGGTSSPPELEIIVSYTPADAGIERPLDPAERLTPSVSIPLSIVNDLVVESRGSLATVHTPRNGTTLRVTLPLGGAMKPLVTPPTGIRGFKEERVLLIEGDSAVRDSVSHSLTELGFTVIAVGSAIECVWIPDEQLESVALALLDDDLPDAEVHEVVACLRHRRSDLPLLLLSAHEPSAMTRGHLDERTDFLQKPFDATTLFHCVRRLLERTGGGDGVADSSR